jgi:hypothetical protein
MDRFLAGVVTTLLILSKSVVYFYYYCVKHYLSILWILRDNAVGIATGYGLDDRGVRVRVPVGSRMFSSLSRPDRFWGPPNVLPNGSRGLYARSKTAGA